MLSMLMGDFCTYYMSCLAYKTKTLMAKGENHPTPTVETQITEMNCPRCAREIELDHYALCMVCYQEVGLYGDEENKKFWFAMKALLNHEFTFQEFEELSDSPAFIQLMRDVLKYMNPDSREKFLLQEINKIIKRSDL